MKPRKVITFPIKSVVEKEVSKEVQLTLKLKQAVTNTYVIHRAYLTQKNNKRQGSASTLTRGEVRGGGRKPWRQKGTGRARAGSNRSPLWRGGGISFGPRPKIFNNKINRKEWRLALKSLLIIKSQNIVIIDNDFVLNEGKTRDFIRQSKILGTNLQENNLFIVSEKEKTFLQSTQNIKTVNIMFADKLSIEQILLAKNLFITESSLKIIEEIYND